MISLPRSTASEWQSVKRRLDRTKKRPNPSYDHPANGEKGNEKPDEMLRNYGGGYGRAAGVLHFASSPSPC